MTKLDGASYGPHQDGAKPGHLVILLHGYGADGNDLIGLAPAFGPLMPDTVFYAPNAPQACEGNPFGYQWFPVSRLDPALALAGAVQLTLNVPDVLIVELCCAYCTPPPVMTVTPEPAALSEPA